MIVKKDTNPVDPNQDPEFVEEQNDDDDEVDQFIEFTLPSEEVMINLEMVPILNTYLQATKNHRQAIEEMNMLRINVTDKSLYLLEFSCHDDLCSYLLLDQTKDNQAYLVADMAKSIQTKISPDNTKILMHFNRELKSPVPFSNIIVIDLEEWVLVPLEKKMNDEEEILNYKWPIITAEWADNNTISVKQPDITEPTPKSIEEWQESEKAMMNTELILNKDK